MRRPIAVALIFLLIGFQAVGYAFEWKEERGTHFVVYYTGSNSAFARTVLYEAEKNYTRIADYFGYARHSNFWTWDKRVKIYLYPDRRTYVQATKMQEWSYGMANYNKKEIASFVKSEHFIESILPHEIAHLIFRDFVGFVGEVPLWLDEGVAQWAEARKREYIHDLAKDYLRQGKILSLDLMMSTDINAVKEQQLLSLPFSSGRGSGVNLLTIRGEELIELYYVQAASLVNFLIERFGTGRFAVFCRSLRDGASLDQALRRAYSPSIRDRRALEEAWLRYIQ